MKSRWVLVWIGIVLPMAAAAFEMSGTVLDENQNPVEGAIVRVQAREAFTLSAADGSYHLVDPNFVLTGPIPVTVGKFGHATGDRLISEDGLENIDLMLRPADPDDPNEDFTALSPEFCRFCHESNEGGLNVNLFQQSERSRHAITGTNPWVEANLLEFRSRNPNESGFCADCHAPGAFTRTAKPGASDLSDPDTVDLLALDPNTLGAPRRHGVQCVTCHRVKEVTNNTKAFNFDGGAVLDKSSAPLQVYGPWDDVYEMRGIPNPVYKESLYCSTCHEYERPAAQGRPAVPGQSTHSEWLRWQARLPADSPDKDIATCQHCHMPEPQVTDPQFACSLLDTPRDPVLNPIRDHTFLGTTLGPGETVNLLDDVGVLDLQAAQTDAQSIEVSVQLTNLKAGHRLPTGIDLRNMLVVVEAWDAAGHKLQPIAGRTSVLPYWAGEGNGPEDLAGEPGHGYAQILSRSRSQAHLPEFQHVEFAEALCQVQDNRIEGNLADTTSYAFQWTGTPGPIQILARVLFRRAPAGFTEKHGLPRTDAMGNPLVDFEITRARLRLEPQSQPAPLSGTIQLDFEADGSGTPFTGASAVADEAYLPQGLRLSSRASAGCQNQVSDGQAYSVEGTDGDRVLAPAPQATHNECAGGILRLDFDSPVGHVDLEVLTDSTGGGFELRALDANDVEIAVQQVYDAPFNCSFHAIQTPFSVHLDHHGIAAIEARGLVVEPIDQTVLWKIRKLAYRFDSFHPEATAPAATPTPGPPPATPTATATPLPASPSFSFPVYAGADTVYVAGLSPPGSRVELRTQLGEVLGAGTADENGRVAIWLLRPLRLGETVLALELRTLQSSSPVTVQENRNVSGLPTGLVVGVLFCLGVIMVRMRRPKQVSLLTFLVLWAGVAAQAAESVTVQEGVTLIDWRTEILRSRGLEVTASQALTQAEVQQIPDFIPGQSRMTGYAIRNSADFRFQAQQSKFLSLESETRLQHRGGFELRWPGGRASLEDFELRAATDGDLFSLTGPDGTRYFRLDNPHIVFQPGARELYLLNIDLRISEELATRLKQPDAAGLAVGVVQIRLTTSDLGRPAPEGSNCNPNYGPSIDVHLDRLNQLQSWRLSGGMVSMSPSTHISNVGQNDIPWFWAIQPSVPWAQTLGQHPYLYFAFYRVEDGVLRQIGRSDIKHAFYATNEPANCPCQGGQVLFARDGLCGDTYSTTNNSEQFYFGPRTELTASTGAWDPLGSHFDVNAAEPTPDSVRSHEDEGHTTLVTHLLLVPESELPTPGPPPTGTPQPETYFIEAVYHVQDDIDLHNNYAWKPVRPARASSGDLPAFGSLSATPLRNGPVVENWVNPAAPGSGQAHAILQTEDGEVRLAVQVTDLGGGNYHYEYVLNNLNFDRKIRSLSIPRNSGVNVTNIAFGDVDGDAGNDWQIQLDANAVTWSAPTFAEDPQAIVLDWGLMYNFRFDADAAPQDTVAGLGIFEPGSGTTLSANSLGPMAQALLTATPSPTATFTPTPSPTWTPSSTPTITNTPFDTPTGLTATPTAIESETPTPTPSIPSPTATPSPTQGPQAPSLQTPLLAGQTVIFGICEPEADLRVSVVPAGGGSPQVLFTSCSAQGQINGPDGLDLGFALQGGDQVQVVDQTNIGLRDDEIVDAILDTLSPMLWGILGGVLLILGASVRRRVGGLPAQSEVLR